MILYRTWRPTKLANEFYGLDFFCLDMVARLFLASRPLGLVVLHFFLPPLRVYCSSKLLLPCMGQAGQAACSSCAQAEEQIEF